LGRARGLGCQNIDCIPTLVGHAGIVFSAISVVAVIFMQVVYRDIGARQRARSGGASPSNRNICSGFPWNNVPIPRTNNGG
jgi:hypothetical protein